jgi:CBS domain containing-hemolysin-like protein
MAQVAKVTPPVGQFVIQTLLQIAGFAAAIAFGIYAVRSVNVATLANRYSQESIQQALAANQLALLATCLTAGTQVSRHGTRDPGPGPLQIILDCP